MSAKKRRKTEKSGRPAGVRVRGEVVRKARLDKGMSKEALARAANLNADTVGKAEAGGPIAEVSLARLALALGVSSDDFVEAPS